MFNDEVVHASPTIFYRGVGYCSLSEAAFGVLLEQFIPGFDVIPGRTFQVPIGGGRSIDFLINGVVIEYHQPRLLPRRGKLGDYSSKNDLYQYRRHLRRVRGNWRKRRSLDYATRAVLLDNYRRKRRAILDNHPILRASELIVAATPEEFYHRVLIPFAIIEAPTLPQFKRMFWHTVKVIARDNGRSRKRGCRDGTTKFGYGPRRGRNH